MSSYSDFILALKPYSYCRLDEPTNCNTYNDISGNGNHMHHIGNLNIIQKSADNQISHTFLGDPCLKAIRPTSQTIGNLIIGNISSIITPKIYIDEFRTDIPNYWGSSNKLFINEIWGELLMDGDMSPNNINVGTHYETFVAIGNIRFYTRTICPINILSYSFSFIIGVEYKEGYYIGDTLYYRKKYKECYIRNLNNKPFDNEFIRFSVGTKRISNTSFEFYIKINGADVIDDADETHLTGIINLEPIDIFSINEYEYYKNAGVMGGNNFSNYSIFFNQTFPNNNFFEMSQSVLESAYIPFYNIVAIDISSQEPTAFPIESNAGSILSLLDTNLIYGNNHYFIESISMINGNDVIATLKPIPNKQYSTHGFKIGDLILIENCTQNNLNGIWTIKDLGIQTLTFTIINTITEEIFTNHVILKRCPIGSGYWVKKYHNNLISYESNEISVNNKRLIIDDTNSKYSIVRLADRNNANMSNPLYIKKNLKSNINIQPNWIRWHIIGDNKRFFLFIGYRQNPLTHSHIIIYGDIRDLSDNEWYTCLVGYNTNTIGNVGYNYAFSYSNWKILSTGHLCCQLTGQPTSDARMIRTKNNTNTYITCYGDLAHHIYPIPIPYAEYN